MIDLAKYAALALVMAGCLSLLITQLRTGVPAMSSSRKEALQVVALLKAAGLAEDAVIYELGSGWGAMASVLAESFPQARIRGFELSPLPYWISRLRLRHHPHIRLMRQDFFRADLTDADAVVSYLMIRPMPKLGLLLDRDLKPGTPVVSLAFWFRDRQPEAVGRAGTAALYRWPARVDTSRLEETARVEETGRA
ncbi:hypothetical protein BJF92_07480 [Rhizobium rhizosphaerae]|uniref:O-methyltransferase C-terminal domain-containing protein n=1 Tax=Xaviernesmea rhizosphaerae TaxID=1672749 RepID=A0A1Q9AD39_9HYPH|nr:class I SAM-dependent methyltransferase [Xaviernesmea rhizosphaerae]OLP52813.1 hypothetical protein BJF92_07480 [Xaviernesmea rhizosphaerae]